MQHVLGDLIDDVVDVGAPLVGADGVYEADLEHDEGWAAVLQGSHVQRLLTCLLELPVCWADTDLPALTEALIHPGDAVFLGTQVQVDVILEGLDRYPLAVEVDLNFRLSACAQHR